jgi:hypothetical protein
MKRSLAVATLAFGMAATAWAQPVQVRPLLGLGLTGGGDTVARVVYSDGDSDKVRAGGLIALTTGLELQFTPLVSVQTLVGYHADNISASNGEVRFDRVPVELLGHFRLNDAFRVGGGARYSTRVRTRASGAASGVVPNEDFEDTLGAVVEGEFTIGRNFGIKLRYVSEKFESKTFPGASDLKGNHVGIYLVGYFF